MRKLLILGSFVVLVCAILGYTFYPEKTFEVVDFDVSMQTDLFADKLTHANNRQVLDKLRALYNTRLHHVTISRTVRIPKILHIMWLGGKVPQEFEPYIKSWRDHHPDWTCIFWTDNAQNYNQGEVVLTSFEELTNQLLQKPHPQRLVVDARSLSFDNRPMYDKAINYGERSDILKWEIVYRFGGVWVDTDFECYKPLDILHYAFDFYTGIQPLDTSCVQLGAALFAACPGHPILKECVQGIKRKQHIAQIIVKSGPIHFTQSFFNVIDRSPYDDIALPASYFYPCGYHQKGIEKEQWCKDESFATHHWAGSWLKPEGFVRS